MVLSCESVARSVLGEPVKSRGAEIFYCAPWRDDHKPSLQINAAKNVWADFPAGLSGTAWQLAAKLAECDPSDIPTVKTWLDKHGLQNGNGNGHGKRVARSTSKKAPADSKEQFVRVKEFYYGENLRKVRLERPNPDGGKHEKTFRWQHREGDKWKSRDGGLTKPLYVNQVFRDRDQLGLAIGFEGEAKADIAGDLGYPGFSFKDLTAAQCHALAGCETVALWPDNDVPGNEQCAAAAIILGQSKQVPTIRVIEPPDELGIAGDIIDAVRTFGYKREHIERLIETARPFLAEAAAVLTAADGAARIAARDFHRTDAGNAERLVVDHGVDLRFVGEWGWLSWDSQRWRNDDFGEVGRRAVETSREILAEASKLENAEERKKLAGFAFKSESRASIANMIKLAEDMVEVRARPAEFDCNPWLLNLINRTIDLQTAKLMPHSRSDLITRLAPVTWDSKAECPMYLDFLDQIFKGNKRLIRFVQKLVGYSLTGLTTEQILIILWGGGANGKSTLIEVLSAWLGEYAAKCPITTFLLKRNDSIPNDVAALAGIRFVYTSEVDEGRRLAESLVKDVTGGEKIRARFLQKEFFEFKPEFKLWLSTNHKPIVKGTDHAIWRRIRLIPFTVTFPREKQDRQLAEKLKTELSGILNWAVDGCLAWQREGLEPPEEVIKATEGYREEMDVIAAFLHDRTETDSYGAVAVKAIYCAYRNWCEENKETPDSQRVLTTKLNERGFDSTHKRDGNYWLGLRLRGEEGKL